MTRDDLVDRKRTIETRLAILNGEMRDKRMLQVQGVIGAEPGLMRSYRQEVADLKVELEGVTAALMRIKADPRNNINHWIHEAARALLPRETYLEIENHADSMLRRYQGSPSPLPERIECPERI